MVFAVCLKFNHPVFVLLAIVAVSGEMVLEGFVCVFKLLFMFFNGLVLFIKLLFMFGQVLCASLGEFGHSFCQMFCVVVNPSCFLFKGGD